MPIRKSVVSASGAGGFVLTTGTSGNTSFDLDRVQAPGTYVINSANGDSALEFYLIAENGSSAGYSSTPVIDATSPFSSVVVYGAGNNDTITVDSKEVVDATTSGDKNSGAAPFINSVNTTDLPNIDDTIIITGGNFATDVTVTFTGTDSVVLNAKSIVRSGSTQLLATRPDAAIEDNAPFTVTIKNPGIPDSTIKTFTQSVTVGGDPAWQTPASQVYNLGVSNTITLVAADNEGSDIDYEITSGSLPAGFSLNGETGVISGTPSGGADGDQTVFTVRATDEGGNIADREFTFTANAAPTWTTVSSDIGDAGELSQDSAVSFQFVANGGSAGGALSYSVQSGSLPSGTSLSSSGLLTGTPDTEETATFTVRVTDEGGLFADREFTAEIVAAAFEVEYLVIAGGGGGAAQGDSGNGGGGAGGYRSSVIGESSGGGSSAESVFTLDLATNYTVTVGAGGSGNNASSGSERYGEKGSNSSFATITSIGGGGGTGDIATIITHDGGSGGGGNHNEQAGGEGTTNQGFDGGLGNPGASLSGDRSGGGGGGAGEQGFDGTNNSGGNGGNGVASSVTGSSTFRAGGGGGSNRDNGGSGGLGGGGNGGNSGSTPGQTNTGGGGGAVRRTTPASNGGSGVVILRYPSDKTITIGAGLTGTTSTVGANKVTEITAGTGNVSWS